jgi:hypothetical protein
VCVFFFIFCLFSVKRGREFPTFVVSHLLCVCVYKTNRNMPVKRKSPEPPHSSEKKENSPSIRYRITKKGRMLKSFHDCRDIYTVPDIDDHEIPATDRCFHLSQINSLFHSHLPSLSIVVFCRFVSLLFFRYKDTNMVNIHLTTGSWTVICALILGACVIIIGMLGFDVSPLLNMWRLGWTLFVVWSTGMMMESIRYRSRRLAMPKVVAYILLISLVVAGLGLICEIYTPSYKYLEYEREYFVYRQLHRITGVCYVVGVVGCMVLTFVDLSKLPPKVTKESVTDAAA